VVFILFQIVLPGEKRSEAPVWWTGVNFIGIYFGFTTVTGATRPRCRH